MIRSWKIDSHERLNDCLITLEVNALQDPPLMISVKPWKSDRTLSQNALYWLWVTEIGKEMGLDKDEVHTMLKGKLLVSILKRDDPDYMAMILSVEKVQQAELFKEARLLKKKIVALTSTTALNVKQMTEYLEDVEMFAAEHNIGLPFPEDIYQQAMKR